MQISRYPGLSLINKGNSNSGREDFKQNIGNKYTSYQYPGPGQADKIVGSVKVLNSLYQRNDAALQFNEINFTLRGFTSQILNFNKGSTVAPYF